jgi:hypothetical protein
MALSKSIINSMRLWLNNFKGMYKDLQDYDGTKREK